jgi:DNA modification methylase
VTVLRGDCVEVMAGMEPDSVDAIVTDPPYGLEFMGKEWDRLWATDKGREWSHSPDGTPRTGFSPFTKARPRYEAGASAQEFHHAWATAALRVARPGAYLLAFGGTRTVHRMTCALEDAGWVIRDLLSWQYASGFPKSKASLKPAWEPIVWAHKPLRVQVEWEHVHHALAAILWLTEQPPSDAGCVATRVARLFGASGTTGTSRSRVPASTSLSIASSWSAILGALSAGGSRSTTSMASRLTTALRTLSSCLSPVTSTITMPRCGCLLGGSSSAASGAVASSSDEWASTLGTLRRSALASAIGPIAQSVAAVLASIADDLSAGLAEASSAPMSAMPGTGQPTEGRTPSRIADARPIVLARKPGPLRDLNIDAARIGTTKDVPASPAYGSGRMYSGRTTPGGDAQDPNVGRWAPNLLLTDPILDGGWEGVVGGGTGGGGYGVRGRGGNVYGGGSGYTTDMPTTGQQVGYGDTGTYSRFFLIPKAPTRERVLSDGRRSPHPTQKPEALIRHLVKLVTPDGGLVLDPFLGSGTLGVVCEGLGMRWAGIEREPEYAQWAEDRIADRQPEWSAA